MRFPKAVTIACAALVAIAGCATGPTRTAETPLQKAYGLMQEWETAQQVGLTFLDNEATPTIAKDTLVRLEGTTTPIVKALAGSVRTVEKIRVDIAAGTASEEQLQAAIVNMMQLTIDAQKALENFQRAIADASASLKRTGSIWEPLVVPLEEPPPKADPMLFQRLNLQEA